MPSRLLPVPEARVGERLDAALAKMLGLSRSQAMALIEQGKVLVDHTTADKSLKLQANQLIEVEMQETSEPIGLVAQDVLSSGSFIRIRTSWWLINLRAWCHTHLRVLSDPPLEECYSAEVYN